MKLDCEIFGNKQNLASGVDQSSNSQSRSSPFFLLNEMKRKDAFHQDSQRSEKETKFVKLSRELEIDHVCLFYHNKSRGILRIKDNSLKHFFTEFVSVAKTPLHFYVLSKLEEKERTMNSKFKVIPESFIRMVACCLIRHR